MKGKKGLYFAWLVVLGFAIIAGLVTALKLFIQGHGAFNANDVLLWTLPLGVYIFLALTSSGLTLLSALPLVFGIKKYELIAKRIIFLSIATLIGAFVSIGLELGSVHHTIYFILSPNFSSPIWWMGAIYGLELVILIVKFWKMHKGDWHSGFSKALGGGSFFLALVAALMIGAIFGITESRVTYFGPFMPIYSLLMAILSGLSLFILYSMIYHKATQEQVSGEHATLYNELMKIFMYVTGTVVLFTMLKFAIESATTIPEFLVYHQFEHAFGTWRVFHTEVIFGLFLPFILLLIPSVRSAVAGKILISALVFGGTLAMHMEILLAGQSRPIGPKAEHYPEFISYFPTVWEWLVFVFAVAVMLLLYTLGERYLKLAGAPE